MDDAQIVELFWTRSETAVSEAAERYGRYCRAIAWNILRNREDCEECVADTWVQAWKSIPPERPRDLRAYLGTLTRHLSLKKVRELRAAKRGAGQTPLVLEELVECLPAADDPDRLVDKLAVTEALDRFLSALPPENRRMFVQRYWYLRSVREIASDLRVSESKVKTSLLRMRKSLRQALEKEGINV